MDGLGIRNDLRIKVVLGNPRVTTGHLGMLKEDMLQLNHGRLIIDQLNHARLIIDQLNHARQIIDQLNHARLIID